MRQLYFSSHRGSCDCCGKTGSLTFVNWAGMDTYACNQCRGAFEDDDEDMQWLTEEQEQ